MSRPTRFKALLTWLLPVVILALGWLVLDALLARMQTRPRPPAYRPAASDRDHQTTLRSLTDLADPAALSGRPLAEEPADLPSPPGGSNLARWQREHGDGVEAYSAWQVERKNAAALASFYIEAATARGFTLVAQHDDARRVTGLAFERGSETLDVRLRDTGSSARVLTRFGYTKRVQNETGTPSEAHTP